MWAADSPVADLKMWQSLGFALQFALGFVMPALASKLGILAGFLAISIVCLAWLDQRVQSLDAKAATTEDVGSERLLNADA